MTLTVSPSSGRIGVGSDIFVTCDAPTVHYISATLANFSTGAGALNAQEFSGFVGNTTLQLGYVNSPFIVNKFDSYGGAVGLVDNAAVSLLVSAFDVSSTLLEFHTFTGFLWDPVSHLSSLLARMMATMATPGLAAILAAVRKTY